MTRDRRRHRSKQNRKTKKYTEEDEEMMIECLEENPDMCINTIIEESKLDISKMTGWRILIARGFRYRTAETKWYISPKESKTKLKWAREQDPI